MQERSAGQHLEIANPVELDEMSKKISGYLAQTMAEGAFDEEIPILQNALALLNSGIVTKVKFEECKKSVEKILNRNEYH